MESVKNVIAYLRVSTQEQSESGLGLAAQQATIEAQASYRGWHIVNWCVDAGATGKDLDRPGLHDALGLLRCKQADALVVAKLDRASRSVVDFAGLLEVARREGWAFVAIDLNVDTSTPTGELLANVMMSVAQWERRTIGLRTKEALQAKKRAGFRLGRPRTLAPALVALVVAQRAAGASLAGIAEALNAAGVPTAHGGQEWRPSTISGILRSAALDDEAVA